MKRLIIPLLALLLLTGAAQAQKKTTPLKKEEPTSASSQVCRPLISRPMAITNAAVSDTSAIQAVGT